MSCRKMLVIGCWFACQLISTEFLGGAEIPARPRIVFILADDLGYRELGCFGQQKIRTPNLDRLAARGMRLTGHYSGNAVCAPSRCVLLTGRHPGRAWIRNNSEAQPEGQLPIPDEELTIAEMLKQQGYVTGAFGKWGLGGPGSEGDPLNQGFDHFFGYNCQRHAHSYYPDYLWQDRRKIPLQNQPAVPGHAKLPPGSDPRNPAAYAAFQGTDYAPDRIRSAAVDFLRANKERPFFLYFPSTLPHVALHVPQADLEPWLKQGWHDPPFTAAAMISRLDSDVGVLLDELDRLQLTENTLVVFSADNGTTHLSEEVDAEFFNSVGELRGLKGSLYEGGVRVPTIVSWPGRIPAGTESDFVSGFEDWMPTLAEFTGARDVRRNDSIGGDGVSLVPVLTTLQQTERPWLYREFPGYGGQLSLRQGPWKLVRQNLSKGSETAELYNLETDPGERTNLAAEHPEKLTTLSNLVTEIRRPSKLFPLRPFDQGGDRGQ
jgi:arylsulfatase A